MSDKSSVNIWILRLTDCRIVSLLPHFVKSNERRSWVNIVLTVLYRRVHLRLNIFATFLNVVKWSQICVLKKIITNGFFSQKWYMVIYLTGRVLCYGWNLNFWVTEIRRFLLEFVFLCLKTWCIALIWCTLENTFLRKKIFQMAFDCMFW